MKQNELNHRSRQERSRFRSDSQAPKTEPALRRLTLYVTEQERGELARIVENEGYGESVRKMLESFVSDLTNSARRTWPWGKQGAQEWLASHRAGLEMEKGGDA